MKYSCLTDDIIHHSLDSEGGGNKFNVHLKYAMACCQSTKHIGDKLIGNPHDIKIFEYIGWEQVDRLNDRNGYAYTNVRPSIKNFLEDKETNKKFTDDKVELKILKQFEFQSKLQRMSVICIDNDQTHFTCYMKGAPQTISKFCQKSSLPKNFLVEIQEYQSKGYRVLAYATKQIDLKLANSLDKVINLDREQVETE